MKIERTKNASKNIAVGVSLKLYQMLAPFLMRTAMLYYMGEQYLGLSGLFTSILHILNLAELGVGSAMVFSMYQPIAEDDEAAICALMRLYRTYYRIIGLVIGVVGIALTPMIPHLIKGTVPDGLNVYVLYLLNLGATVLTYWLFAYKNCLLNAHQRTDVSSLVTILTTTVQYGLQLVIMIVWKNYYLHMIVALLTQALNNVITAFVANKMYPRYQARGKLDREKTRSINGRIRDLFTSKMGSVILTSGDSVVISAFLGLSVLAVYQNYYFILTSVLGIVEIMLQSVMAGLGNSFLTETKQKNFKDLKKFTFLFIWLTGLFSCCFLALYQPFMEIWVGKGLMLGNSAVIWLALYFFVCTLCRLLSVYKDAAGLWHKDRFRPLVAAVVNVTLNLLWVRSMGVYGVLMSTVVSVTVVELPWLLYNIFTVFFYKTYFGEYIRHLLGLILAAAVAAVAVWLICLPIQGNPWVSLVLRGIVGVTVPNLLLWLLLHRTQQFIPAVQMVDKLTKNKLKLERLFSCKKCELDKK